MTAVLPSRVRTPADSVAPDDVREVLSRSILADGLDFVLDVDRSAGSHLVDARVLGDPALPHLFFVDGGALAVENALKVAFDWKSRRNEGKGVDPALGTKVLHLQGAFHGRSGYTLSLTNTDPNKVARFPKFDWPRIDAPWIQPGMDDEAMDALEAKSLRQARAAFEANPNDIACFLAEPIQGEG